MVSILDCYQACQGGANFEICLPRLFMSFSFSDKGGLHMVQGGLSPPVPLPGYGPAVIAYEALVA